MSAATNVDQPEAGIAITPPAGFFESRTPPTPERPPTSTQSPPLTSLKEDLRNGTTVQSMPGSVGSERDAAALRSDPEFGLVWQHDGSMADVVDGLLGLPAPGNPPTLSWHGPTPMAPLIAMQTVALIGWLIAPVIYTVVFGRRYARQCRAELTHTKSYMDDTFDACEHLVAEQPEPRTRNVRPGRHHLID